jgi:hypothetical protein
MIVAETIARRPDASTLEGMVNLVALLFLLFLEDRFLDDIYSFSGKRVATSNLAFFYSLFLASINHARAR